MKRIIQLAFKDIMVNFCPGKLNDDGAKWIIDRTYELANKKFNN